MKVKVSVLTTTYNHAPYIAEALDSFLMQQTDFPFEVIVHDDASTDGTADIIREYAKKYPDIIRPIFQKENQYSKGKYGYSFMEPLIRGEYIAQCEGDDYWCDEFKLQKQADYLDKHPECSYCFCNSYKVDLNSKILEKVSPVDFSRILSSREMISKPEIYLSTAGIMYRSKDSMEFPLEMMAGEAGDIPLRNFLMLRGNAYGFADYMACYRVMVPGSWSDRYAYDAIFNPQKFLEKNAVYLQYYHRFDAYTDGRFHQELLPNIQRREFVEHCIKAEWKELKKPVYKKYFDELTKKQKAGLFFKCYFPFLMNWYQLLKYGKALN